MSAPNPATIKRRKKAFFSPMMQKKALQAKSLHVRSLNRNGATKRRTEKMAYLEKIAFIGNALCVGALVAFAGASFAVLIANAFGL